MEEKRISLRPALIVFDIQFLLHALIVYTWFTALLRFALTLFSSKVRIKILKKHHQNKMGKDLLSDKSGMLLIFHVFIDY